jgi:hypothetical protein
MVDLTPERLAQLARARDLARQARERIRNLTPEEKACHPNEKAATLLQLPSAKQARKKQDLPVQTSEPKEEIETCDTQTTQDEPSTIPPTPGTVPDVQPLVNDVAPPVVSPVEDVPATPKRRVKRRIVIEQSSSDSGSCDEEIVGKSLDVPGRRRRLLTAAIAST